MKMMSKLTNKKTKSNIDGDYVIKETGDLDVQYQMDDEAFTTITGASFTTAGEGLITLPVCFYNTEIPAMPFVQNLFEISAIQLSLHMHGNRK